MRSNDNPRLMKDLPLIESRFWKVEVIENINFGALRKLLNQTCIKLLVIVDDAPAASSYQQNVLFACGDAGTAKDLPYCSLDEPMLDMETKIQARKAGQPTPTTVMILR